MTAVPPLASAAGARPSFSARALAWPLAAAAPLLAGTAYIATHNPHVPGSTYVCPLYSATGLLCPGCGGTRAVYDLAHGDVLGALHMHPVFTLAVPVIVLVWFRWVLRTQGFRLREWPFPTWLAFTIPAVLVTFSVLRNVAPFDAFLGP